MSWFYNIVALLKKHGYSWQARFDIFCIVASLACLVIDGNILFAYIAAMFFLFLLWEVDDARNKERIADYKKQLDDECDENAILHGEIARLEEKVELYRLVRENKQENPIKSNRIVSDKTFAVRLRSFIKDVNVCDACSADEQEYLLNTAEWLLKWQTKTVRKDSEEYKYLERLGLMPHPSANVEGHAEEATKEEKPKKRTASRKKPKTETKENENKD